MKDKPNIFEFWGIDKHELKETIGRASSMQGEEFYNTLLSITGFKNSIKEALDEVDGLEREVKSLINDRAKKDYGNDWQAIKGDNFKITRSKTGSMYLINGKPNSKFVVVKSTVNSDAVNEFVENNERLPKGIEINDQRGESLRITVK